MTSIEIERPHGSETPPVTPAPAGARTRGRRLCLHGVTTYACRYCAAPIRVVSAAYLPEECPACGHGTWTADGRCTVTDVCGAARPRDGRRRAHCPRCGGSVWRRMGRPGPR
jgi:ribosomal protein S27AE